MNTLVKFTLAITLSLLGISESNAQWKKKIVGNGNITTKTVTTKTYDIIDIVGSMDIFLETGSEGTITVTTDENLHEYVIVESDGNTLKIKMENNISYKSRKGIHILVPFMDLTKVSLVGSGDVETKNTIKSDSFETSITGSGDMNLAIESNQLDAKVIGSGDLTLSGITQELEVKISGSGDFKGSALKSNNTQAYVSGSGDAKVNATTSLKARVNGSGDIYYSGNPGKSDTKVLGSGSIKSM